MIAAPPFTVTPAITAALTRIERARGFLDAALLLENWIRRMDARALVLEAHHTMRLDGAGLTPEQSARILAGDSAAGVAADEVRALQNVRAALDLAATWRGDIGPITEGMLRDFHERLLAGLRRLQTKPGEYRQVQSYLVDPDSGHVVLKPRPAREVPGQMQKLTAWLSDPGDLHPVLVSGIALLQILQIQPFLEANGRIARLAALICLYRSGYDCKRLFSLSEPWDRDRAAYFRAIQTARAKGMEFTPWLEYFTGTLAAGLDEVRGRGERAVRGDLLARRFALSERQVVALDEVLDRGRITTQVFEALCPGSSRKLLQRDLRAMADRGLFVEWRSGPGGTNRFYVLAEALREGSRTAP